MPLPLSLIELANICLFTLRWLEDVNGTTKFEEDLSQKIGHNNAINLEEKILCLMLIIYFIPTDYFFTECQLRC